MTEYVLADLDGTLIDSQPSLERAYRWWARRAGVDPEAAIALMPGRHLLAARLLGAEPHRCVVLEDSPAGVEAGLAAGMRVVAVTITHAPGELPGAHVYVRDVAEWLRLKASAGVDVQMGP